MTLLGILENPPEVQVLGDVHTELLVSQVRVQVLSGVVLRNAIFDPNNVVMIMIMILHVIYDFVRIYESFASYILVIRHCQTVVVTSQ